MVFLLGMSWSMERRRGAQRRRIIVLPNPAKMVASVWMGGERTDVSVQMAMAIKIAPKVRIVCSTRAVLTV